jgi:hypothetical protein
MTRFRIRRRESVGVALAEDRLVAVRLGRRGAPVGEIWSRSLPVYRQGCGWPELASAFAELRADLGITAGTLHVALLPPLVQVRRVELPRLDDRTLRHVLARDAGRYFPCAGEPKVIGVTRLSNGRRSPVPYLVTAADAGLVASLFEAAPGEWQVDSLVSGYSAWEAGARQLWPELARGTGYLIFSGEQRTDVLRFDRGRTSLVRRFGVTAEPAGVAASLVEEGSPAVRCGLVGQEERGRALASELEAHGLLVLSPGTDAALDSPDLFAAMAAGRSRGPQLTPDEVRLEQQGRAARLSARLLTAAAALLLLTAGLELWGAHRELTAVEARRAALRSNVAEAMMVRDEMRGLDATLRALATAEVARSQWATALVNVADHLPTDAHLVGFRGDADSLVLEGEARHAGSVFESLQKAPGVLAVRADAPIRQEARDSGPAIEHFSLAARLGADSTGATQ